MQLIELYIAFIFALKLLFRKNKVCVCVCVYVCMHAYVCISMHVNKSGEWEEPLHVSEPCIFYLYIAFIWKKKSYK